METNNEAELAKYFLEFNPIVASSGFNWRSLIYMPNGQNNHRYEDSLRLGNKNICLDIEETDETDWRDLED